MGAVHYISELHLVSAIGAALIGVIIWMVQRFVKQIDTLVSSVQDLKIECHHLSEVVDKQDEITNSQWKTINTHTRKIANLEGLVGNGKGNGA